MNILYLKNIHNSLYFRLFSVILPLITIYILTPQVPLAFSTSDPLFCPTHNLFDCYFKMTFKISKLNHGEKTDDFKINITDNPRHIDPFKMNKKTMIRYLLPGEYRISVIFKNKDQGLFCVGIAKAGENRFCDNIARLKHF